MKQVGIIEGGEFVAGGLDPATLRVLGIEAEGDIGMLDGREQAFQGGELLGIVSIRDILWALISGE